MKRYILKIFGFILLSFVSCDKGDVSNSTSIVGTWELKQAQNGMIPTVEYSAGNGNILKFSNSTYEKYVNNNLVRSGSYSIIEDNTVEAEVGLVIPSGQFIHRIVYDNDLTSSKTFFQISENKLTFLSGYFPLDGGSHLSYERAENSR